MKASRISRWHIIIGIIIPLVTYNEFLCFIIKKLSWPILDDPAHSIRILLVADPQILSTQSEPLYPLSIPAIWDANRFVSYAFHHAVSFSNPEVVIFLGDLLNDGSISNEVQFNDLANEFKQLFYVSKGVKHIFYISGDNDIGGEGRDTVSLEKIRRFNYAFDTTDRLSYKYINLFHVNAIPGAAAFSPGPKPLALTRESFNIVVSHFSILPAAKKSIKENVQQLNASIIFSAHDHDSYKFVGSKATVKANKFFLLKKEEIIRVDLKEENLYEISVPTCSYRMGKRNYGFGLVHVGDSGMLTYTVLWLPCRFTMLVLYLFGAAICLALCLKPIASFFILKLGIYDIPAKYHHV